MNLERIRDAGIVGFSLAFIFLVIHILVGNPFQVLDRPLHDAFERAALKANDRIVLVDLDAESVTGMGSEVYFPDLWMPQVLGNLSQAQAVGVVLPLFKGYGVPGRAQEMLRQARLDSLSRWYRLSDARASSLLDSVFAYQGWDDDLVAVLDALKAEQKFYFSFRMLEERHTDQILPFSRSIPNRNPDTVRANTGILDQGDFAAPPSRWIYSSGGLGYLNVYYSEDGLVREVPLIALCKGDFYNSMGFTMFEAVEGRKDLDLPSSRVMLWGDEEFRLTEGYGFRIHYTSRLEDFTRIPVEAILSGRVPPDTFAGKMVLVGSTFEPYSMCAPTPVDARMPRMVLEANLVTGLLDRNQASPPNMVVTFVVTLILGVLGGFAAMIPWRKFTLPGFALLVAAFYIIVAAAGAAGTRIDFFTPLAVSVLAVVAGSIIYYYTEGRRRSYIQQMVRSYFPADQEEYYTRHFMDLPYYRINRDSAVMAVNLDFTKKEKSLQEALKSFEEFRGKLLQICRKQGGIRMSFMGDSSLFLFAGQGGYISALKASLAIRRFFTNFNARYRTEGIGEFKLGIGLAGGQTLVSTLGRVPLVDLAVFGTPVLVARELAIWNFELKTTILIDERLHDYLAADAKARELGQLEIVGQAYTVYEYLR